MAHHPPRWSSAWLVNGSWCFCKVAAYVPNVYVHIIRGCVRFFLLVHFVETITFYSSLRIRTFLSVSNEGLLEPANLSRKRLVAWLRNHTSTRALGHTVSWLVQPYFCPTLVQVIRSLGSETTLLAAGDGARVAHIALWNPIIHF